jgi:hypothetical protein
LSWSPAEATPVAFATSVAEAAVPAPLPADQGLLFDGLQPVQQRKDKTTVTQTRCTPRVMLFAPVKQTSKELFSQSAMQIPLNQ